MKIQMRDLTVINFLCRHFNSAYLFASAVVFHFGCMSISKSEWLSVSTSVLLVAAFGYNTYDMFWSKKTRIRARESRKLRIQLARMEKMVPDHIPDAQALKYLKKKIKINKKKRKEENELPALQDET